MSTIPTTGMSNGLILSAAGDKLYSANRAFHNFYRTEVIGGVEVFEIGNKPLAEGDIMGSVVYYNSPADESVSG